ETFGMTALETVNNKYMGGDTSLACSDQTATRVDEEVVRLIQQAYEEARRILEENKEKLHELAKFLYERETITGEQFMEIVNRVPQL
ncbi:cell division protein FtsH, partial [[Clostridium] scindens]|nr:cell division protein FtsH [[Clostridium] scindens]